MSVGEKAIVADAHESGRKNVEQKAPNKFLGAQRHGALLIVAFVVLPAEADFAILDGLYATIGDGDSMGVASEVLEHLGGTAERTFGVDDPLFVPVGSRYSCGFPMVETEQPAKPFTALNGALETVSLSDRGLGEQ